MPRDLNSRSALLRRRVLSTDKPTRRGLPDHISESPSSPTLHTPPNSAGNRSTGHSHAFCIALFDRAAGMAPRLDFLSKLLHTDMLGASESTLRA